MNEPLVRVFVIGFGNPGRGDDGLGPAFAEAVQLLNLPGVTVDADYQLNVEDAAAIAEHDVVLFVDADATGPAPWSFRRLAPKPEMSFSSHSAEPGAVLALAHELFHAPTKGYILGIRGYVFDYFVETLSARAAENLRAALDRFAPLLRERSLESEAEND